MKLGFCDFCDTLDEDGKERTDLSRAQCITADGQVKWICDLDYYYYQCVVSKNDPNLIGPCRENPCKHQPKLITDWKSSE